MKRHIFLEKMSLLDHFKPLPPRKTTQEQTLDDLSSDEEDLEDFSHVSDSSHGLGGENVNSDSCRSDTEGDEGARPQKKVRWSYKNEEKRDVVAWMEAKDDRTVRGAVKEFGIPRRNIRSKSVFFEGPGKGWT